MRYLNLAPHEQAALLLSDPAGEGGFQSLLRKLIRQFDAATGRLGLDTSDLKRIPRYAFDYGVGGWEDILIAIFGQQLGPQLDS
jgi:hypothetical protein